MKIALYTSRYDGSENIQNPPSLQYLAGCLIEKKLVDENNILFANNIEQIKSFRPDILGIGSVSQCIRDAIRTAREIRAYLPFCWTILGGYHVSALPDCLPEVFDIGVVGEGELTFADIVMMRAQSNVIVPDVLKQIHGVCFRDANREIVRTDRKSVG